VHREAKAKLKKEVQTNYTSSNGKMTVSSLLLVAALSSTAAAAAAATLISSSSAGGNGNGSGGFIVGRIPQHYVPSTKRNILYPPNHPLGRHLLYDFHDSEEDEESYERENSNIVGGYGSNSQNRRRRRRLESGRGVIGERQEEADVTALLRNVADIEYENEMTEEGQDDDDYHDVIEKLPNDDTVVDPLTTLDDEEEFHIDNINNNNNNTSSSSSSLYQPIRLRAILTDDESQYLTFAQRTILMEDIINPALSAWSQALLLVPVHSSEGQEGGTLVVDQTQLYDGISCGPGLHSGMPSVRVPLEHMTEGLVDTDVVIYISISFFTNTNTNNESNYNLHNTTTTGAAIVAAPIYHLRNGVSGPEYIFQDGRLDDNNNTTVLQDARSSEGPSSTPPTYFPTLTPSEIEPNAVDNNRPTCSGTYLASATYCSTDQYDRPVAGMLSLCIPTNDIHDFFHNPEQIARNTVTVMHELGHILGFNAQSLAYIRNPDTGLPRTPRDKEGNVPITTNVECTGISSSSSPRVYSDIPLPSSDILQFQIVRGGVRVATITTPTVVRIARNHFGCRTLVGAELESGEGGRLLSIDDYDIIDEQITQDEAFVEDDKRPLYWDTNKWGGYHMFLDGKIEREDDDDDVIHEKPHSRRRRALTRLTSSGECIGDHWSRRLFRTDLMNPIIDDVPYSMYISSLTLAYFADTGWYKINADRIASASKWGRNAGCNFVEQQCLSSKGRVTAANNPFFCDNFLEEEPLSLPQDNDDDKEHEEVGVAVRGPQVNDRVEEENLEIHGCSLDSSRKAVCSLVEYDTALPIEFNYFLGDKELNHSQYFGGSDPTLDFCPVFEGFANGHCGDKNAAEIMTVSSNLEVFGEDNSRCVIGHVNRKRTALCLPIACVIQEQSLMVKVDGYWKTCSYAGQIISVWWNPNDYVTCPDPSRMCPTFFCPQDCFREGGICDYDTGQCMCAVAQSTTNSTTNSSFHLRVPYPRFEPCSTEGGFLHTLIGANGSPSQVVERINFELPEYYVENITLLTNDRRNFDDKVSHMFAQLSTGEVVSLVCSFVLCAIFTFIVYSQVMKCYRRRYQVAKSLSKVKFSVGSLSGLLSSASRASLNDTGHDDNDDSLPHPRRPTSHNPQKDKMVATLLVQMRTSEGANGSSSIVATPTIVDLSLPSDGEVLVNRSELPPLPDGGRVLAVVGARIVEDEITVVDSSGTVTMSEDGQSSSSGSPQRSTSTSTFSSPLFEDERGARIRTLRLRHHPKD
jgi:hypothetical protein